MVSEVTTCWVKSLLSFNFRLSLFLRQHDLLNLLLFLLFPHIKCLLLALKSLEKLITLVEYVESKSSRLLIVLGVALIGCVMDLPTLLLRLPKGCIHMGDVIYVFVHE